MGSIIIFHDAKCKHCLNRIRKKNDKNKYQSFCSIHNKFITLKNEICEKFRL